MSFSTTVPTESHLVPASPRQREVRPPGMSMASAKKFRTLQRPSFRLLLNARTAREFTPAPKVTRSMGGKTSCPSGSMKATFLAAPGLDSLSKSRSLEVLGCTRVGPTLLSRHHSNSIATMSHNPSSTAAIAVEAEAPEPEAPSQHNADFAPWPNGGGLVHREATVHETARVEPGAVVFDKGQVGEGAVIGAGSVVGPRVTVGRATVLHYNVTLQRCVVGSACVLHQGVSVGAEGFGFFIDGNGQMVKKPQPMGVVIGDGVEIGANSCVDRGSWRDTVIGDNTKIDNLVQVGHNAVIGRCCIICGQTGLGGSSTLGDYVVLAGQVGVADHVTICSQVRVGAKSGVSSDITKPGDYAGYPTVPAPEWRRQVVLQRRAARPPSQRNGSQDDSS